MITVIGNSYPQQRVVDVREDDPGMSREQRLRQRDRELVEQAKTHFRAVEQAESKWRMRALDDLRFRAGETQWETSVMAARSQRGQERPCLVMNLFPKYLHQIVNEARLNPVAMKAVPADGGADIKTAQVIQGLMRAIEVASDADVAYDTAIEHAATMGKGYWRLLTEYSDPWSFEQDVRIKRVLNPFAVYLDHTARIDPDYHTARYGLVVERVPKEWVCDTYGISQSMYAGWANRGDSWVYRDETQVADYYVKRDHPFWLLRLPDGGMRYVPIVEAPEDAEGDEQEDLLQDQGWHLLEARLREQGVVPLLPDEQGAMEHRDVRKRQSAMGLVRWLKIVGEMVVEQSFWPGQFIPIVPVLGEEVLMEHEIDYRGIVRDAQDAQRMFNYSRSSAAEALTLAPKAPFIGTPQQFEGYEEMWGSANSEAYSALYYNAHVVNGAVLPAPYRVQAEPQIEAVTNFANQSAADMHAIIGIYPSAVGDQSNEVSGIAIRNRQQQSQMGSAHYDLNRQRAIRYTARQLVDLIPRIYVEPGRVARVMGEDGTEEFVALHPQAREMQGEELQQLKDLGKGITGVFALGMGKYDVIASSGPSYQNKRQETGDRLVALAAAIPKVAELMPDLIVGTQDFDESDEGARRLRASLPPGVLGDDLEDAKPEVQVQMLMNKVNALTEEVKALNAYAQQREGQAQEAIQAYKQIELQLANKEGELEVKVREAMADRQFEAEKLRLEWARLELERQKVALDHRERRTPPVTEEARDEQ